MDYVSRQSIIYETHPQYNVAADNQNVITTFRHETCQQSVKISESSQTLRVTYTIKIFEVKRFCGLQQGQEIFCFVDFNHGCKRRLEVDHENFKLSANYFEKTLQWRI